MSSRYLKIAAVIGAVALGAAGILFLADRYEFAAAVARLVAFIRDPKANPFLFLGLMATLPVIGFPISLFLLSAGIKFGVAWGLIISAVTMLVHLLISHLLARRLLSRPMAALFQRFGYRLPKVPRDRVALFTFVFVAVPGLPYALKNYSLVLAGVPFWHYLIIGWSVQWVMGIPFLGLGGAAAASDLVFLLGFFALLAAVFFLVRYIRKRYAPLVNGPP